MHVQDTLPAQTFLPLWRFHCFSQRAPFYRTEQTEELEMPCTRTPRNQGLAGASAAGPANAGGQLCLQ